MSTNFEILDKAEKLELLSAEIYAALARRFGDDEAAVELFTRLCEEEEQHAARVRMVAAQSRRDSKLLGKITVDSGELDDVVIDMTTVLANLRAGRWEADLAQTKRILLDLEERSSQAHAHAINGLHESLKRFFEQLALQDKAHEELLRS